MAKLKTPTMPASKTVQRLLAQIHAEAEAATLAALSAKDGIVFLHDIDRETAHIRVNEYCAAQVQLKDGSGYLLDMVRKHVMPESWRDAPWMKDQWRPGQWDVTLVRVDGQGRKWTCDLGAHVTDDFGTLVCVKGGTA